MRLRYSTSLVATLIFTHIIFTTDYLSYCESIDTSSEEQNLDEADDNLDEPPTEEQRLAFVELAKIQVLKALNLKAPPKNIRKRLYVPRDVLRNYAGEREKVRDVIPDDRDFYGKINPEEIEKLDEKLESMGSNDYSYDIEVVMGPAQRGSDSDGSYKFKGESSNMMYIGTDDPQDVPTKLEHTLPPHTPTGHTNGQRFTSVYLKFNLSQQHYLKPTTPDELRGAELRLTRDRVIPSDLSCKIRPDTSYPSDGPKILTLSQQNEPVESNNSSTLQNEQTTRSEEQRHHDNSRPTKECVFHHRSRYQRLYVLDITGMDEHESPITRIFHRVRIDTLDSKPLVFDVRDILRRWLKYPNKNYGLIIRVRDEVEGSPETLSVTPNNFQSSATNASGESTSEIQSDQVGLVNRVSIEHLRLKRETRMGESDSSWLLDRPAIVMYTTPMEGPRRTRRNPQESGHEQDVTTSTSTTSTIITDSPSNLRGTSTQDSASSTGQPSKHDNDNSSSNNNNSSWTNKPVNTSHQTSSTSARARPSRRTQSSSRSGGGRSSKPNRRPPPQTRDCSLKEFKLDFDEVGWSDWIIAPRAYNMNYCSGECQYPIAENQNATNHAIIQSIFHSVGRVVPKACCAATQLGEVTLLYQVEDTVSMRRYDGMIASACACL